MKQISPTTCFHTVKQPAQTCLRSFFRNFKKEKRTKTACPWSKDLHDHLNVGQHRDKKLPNTSKRKTGMVKQARRKEKKWVEHLVLVVRTITFKINKWRCHTKYNAQKKKKHFLVSSSSSSHLYLLPPALALITLSKDSLIGVLLTNTVK